MAFTRDKGPDRPYDAEAGAIDAPPPESALSWKSFLSTYLPALIYALGAGIALPAVPTLAKSFNVGFGVASGIVTAFLLGNLVGTIPSGWLIDRFGRRSVMIAGPILTSATALWVWNASSFSEVLVLRFFSGCAAQMWVMGRLAAISQNAPESQRGRLVSWMFGMDNTGKLAGPVIGCYIASEWDATAPFLAYSLIALVALAFTLMFGEKATRVDPGARSSKPVSARKLTIRQIILPRLVYFGVALFAGLTRGPVTADLLHLYAAYAYHLGPAEIGYLATGAAVIAWPIGFIAGWILDRFGRKRTMVPGFTGVSISMALLSASAYWDYSYSWYVGFFFLAVATQSLTGGSVQTVGADVAPKEARGFFLGMWRFTGQGGQAIGPIIFAILASQVNYSTAFLFTAGCAACVAALLIFRVPETRSDTA